MRSASEACGFFGQKAAHYDTRPHAAQRVFLGAFLDPGILRLDVQTFRFFERQTFRELDVVSFGARS